MAVSEFQFHIKFFLGIDLTWQSKPYLCCTSLLFLLWSPVIKFIGLPYIRWRKHLFLYYFFGRNSYLNSYVLQFKINVWVKAIFYHFPFWVILIRVQVKLASQKLRYKILCQMVDTDRNKTLKPKHPVWTQLQVLLINY